MGPIGGRGEAAKGQPRAPPPPVLIGQGGGRRPPFPFPLSPSLSSPSPTRKREGVLLPVGVGLLLARPSWPADPLPLAPLYTGAGGTSRHKLIFVIVP